MQEEKHICISENDIENNQKAHMDMIRLLDCQLDKSGKQNLEGELLARN
jgi:hypothetical protein